MNALVSRLFDASGRLSYRRLLAFVVSTALLLGRAIDQDAWLIVTCVFIGFEGVERLAAQAKNPNPPVSP